jgi:hypothetical protein
MSGYCIGTGIGSAILEKNAGVNGMAGVFDIWVRKNEYPLKGTRNGRNLRRGWVRWAKWERKKGSC